MLAFEPRVDPPLHRVSLRGHPLRQRHRDIDREQRRQLREPAQLAFNGADAPVGTGEAYDFVVPEPVERVDRPRGDDTLDG
jgi:hypothetical protein